MLAAVALKVEILFQVHHNLVDMEVEEKVVQVLKMEQLIQGLVLVVLEEPVTLQLVDLV
jgi:hypothetical protein